MRKQSSGRYGLGRTIAAERDRPESESERMLNRKKVHSRKLISGIVVIAAMVVVGLILGLELRKFLSQKEETLTVMSYEPKVKIEDEDAQGVVTVRMREFVGRVERDFSDLGYKVTRAVIPLGKIREVDIYLEGRTEFYKLNIDRGSAVSAEDAVAMLRYLTENEIEAAYVDVRVEGKGYWK